MTLNKKKREIIDLWENGAKLRQIIYMGYGKDLVIEVLDWYTKKNAKYALKKEAKKCLDPKKK